jgi:solute carrier family 26 (sodium-independent sulfate anion transporter), member 11
MYSPWAKRALAAAGFGYPSFETADGRPQHFKPIYSLAETEEANFERERERQEERLEEHNENSGKATHRKSATAQDVEKDAMGGFTTQRDKMFVEKLEVSSDGQITTEQLARMTAVHGINRPFFHPDIQSALMSAIASHNIMEAMDFTLEEKERIEEKED